MKLGKSAQQRSARQREKEHGMGGYRGEHPRAPLLRNILVSKGDGEEPSYFFNTHPTRNTRVGDVFPRRLNEIQAQIDRKQNLLALIVICRYAQRNHSTRNETRCRVLTPRRPGPVRRMLPPSRSDFQLAPRRARPDRQTTQELQGFKCLCAAITGRARYSP